MSSTQKLVEEIKIGDRAREDYGDLESLKDSMTKFGQLHPIIITNNNKLVAGGRRLSAALLLDWEYIEVKYFNDLSELERKEIELEENLIRKDLEWHETVKLRDQINKIKKQIAEERGESWKVEDTADFVGTRRDILQKDIDLARDMREFPELLECKNKNEAKTKARRLKSAVSRKMKNAIIPHEVINKDNMLGVFHGDCREILKKIPSNSVDLIIADPPYAINFDEKERNERFIDTYGESFTDELREVMEIVEPAMEECARVLKPGCHIYLFFGIQHYNAYYCALELTWRMNTQKTPLFWIKGSGENYKPYHRFTVNYEACFFSWKYREEESEKIRYEQREFNKPHNCTFEHSLKVGKKEHPAEKPLSLYKEIIEISSNEGDIVLDPFSGSGKSGIAAKQLGRKIILIEQLEEWYDLSKHNVDNAEDYFE